MLRFVLLIFQMLIMIQFLDLKNLWRKHLKLVTNKILMIHLKKLNQKKLMEN